MDSTIRQRVQTAADAAAVIDMHTHLYAPAFGASDPRMQGAGTPLLLWGIDELLGYHYFVDEVFRAARLRSPNDALDPRSFWTMSLRDRADLIWRELFVERPPVSEACVGLIDILVSLGLDPDERDLSRYRKWFSERDLEAHIDEVMHLAGVRRIVMTNEPFAQVERAKWLADPRALRDSRFAPVLRIDPIVEQWPEACRTLAGWGYEVQPDLSGQTVSEVRRFIDEWIERTDPVYLACSLSPGFRHDSESEDPAVRSFTSLFDTCLVGAARDHGLALALMIGARRSVHPEMGLAGDSLGPTDNAQLESIAHAHPDVTFLITLLSRENQHELCVTARKFANVVPFGCWWYLNTTSQITEITRMRLELLGTDFVPQHSDARVLEQLIYKWRQSRRIIAACVAERYDASQTAGARIDDRAIDRDMQRLFSANFEAAVNRAFPAN